MLRLPHISRATRSVKNGATLLTVVSEQGCDILPDLIRVLTENGSRIQRVAPEEPTLEDVFIAKTGRTLAEDTRVRA